MKRLTLIIGLSAVLIAQSQAAMINAYKVGPIFTTTPIAETAFQALTQFRGQFTPVNIAVTALNVLLITKIGDGINYLRVQMASPLPAAQSPAGWADSNTPPATATPSVLYRFTGDNYAGTITQVVGHVIAYYGQNASNVTYSVVGTQLQIRGALYVNCNQDVPVCPAGYSGTPCSLTNAALAQWPSDGQATVSPVNGVLTPNARDPDNAGIVSGDISRIGTDEYNNPVKETVSANGQNGYDYRRDTQSINPTTGEPTVQRDQFSVNGTGQVTSVTSNTYNNSTVSSVNTTPIDVSMLAKDATLALSNAKLDDVKTLLAKDTAAYTEAPTTRTIAASLDLVLNKIKSKLPTVAFSDVSPDCPTFSQFIPFIDITLTIDAYCTMDQFIRPTLQAVSLFLYALLAFFIVMSA